MKTKISFLSVMVNLLLALGKITIGIMAKSAALVADGIHSGTDVLSSVVSFTGIRIAEKPADREHPYGHGKAEVVSGFVITVIIFISAVFILYHAVTNLVSGVRPELSYPAFVVLAISAVVNALMSQLKIHYGKKYDSISLITDGIHSRVDVLMSSAIFVGLVFTDYFASMDSILALGVGAYLFYTSLKLAHQTTNSLIGKSAGNDIETKIVDVVEKSGIRSTGLRTQMLGSRVFADICVQMPSDINVALASEEIKKLEKRITTEVEKVDYVAIRIESQDVSSKYFQPSLGKGFGWRSRGRMEEKLDQASGAGPGGSCVCPECGREVGHERGRPCAEQKCPACGCMMMRKTE